MKRKIILEIDAGGENVVVETTGEAGRQCMETSQFLEEALGETVARRLKSEYFSQKARARGNVRMFQAKACSPR